jgi:hypothetical protein
MSMTIPAAQGRAPSLYDEQLQRQQQERKLFAGFTSGSNRLSHRREPMPPAPDKAGAES